MHEGAFAPHLVDTFWNIFVVGDIDKGILFTVFFNGLSSLGWASE